MRAKKYKGKVKCIFCEKAMIYNVQSTKTLVCSTYHKKGKGCIRNTVTDSEIEELLNLLNISIEDVKTIYIGNNDHFKVILKNNETKSFDGCSYYL